MRILSQRGYQARRLLLHVRRHRAEAEDNPCKAPAGVGVDEHGVSGVFSLHRLLLLWSEALAAGDANNFRQLAAAQDSGRTAG